MNEMIERIAKTISDEGQLRSYGDILTPYRHSSMDQNFINDCLAIAKAAIKAMREPTDDMIDAADISNSLEVGSSAYGCWQAMIDKALEE